MICFPNAKINLGLNILNRRPDGYHNLDTVMIPVNWTDILEIIPAESTCDNLTVTGRGVDCEPEKNLVMKAVKALRAKCDFPGVEIHLHKIIPDGAGLGGGSADAAFTLTMLRQLFNLPLSDAELSDIAATLGADCPVFVTNRASHCTGTGTILAPIDNPIPQGTIVAIVKPPVSVSTKEAYAHVHPAETATPLSSLLKELKPECWQGKIVNDFEASVFPAHPLLPQIKQYLLEAGAFYASMSGSGSALFGLFKAGSTDESALSDRLAESFPECDIRVSLMQ